MDSIVIRGGRALKGNIQISGAKNAALPILCATLLADGEHELTNVPALRDIVTTAALLRYMGVSTVVEPPVVKVKVEAGLNPQAPYELVKQMRASVLVLGPLAARFGKAKVSLPGGCAIGARPIDQHLKGLEAMGAKIELDRGYVILTVPRGRLSGADIMLDMPTVTGTENLMCAASLAEGTTVLRNAAREPEVEELAVVLNSMGAKITGAGTDEITIVGVEGLNPMRHAIRADRIEAGTYMVAAAITGGDVVVQGITKEPLAALISKMRAAGVVIDSVPEGLRVRAPNPLKATDVVTEPHPGFPTDMQAQFMVLMTGAMGSSVITETIFENRFMHVSELQRMGARIDVKGRLAIVHGPSELSGAEVMATDLRASASLVLAGLKAQGETEVLRVYHLDRGYEHLETKLKALGADIERRVGARS